MPARKGTTNLNLFQHASKHWSKLLLGVAVIAALFLLNRITLKTYFPIQYVRVHGVKQLNLGQVQQTIKPMVENGFFGVDVDYIRDRLMQMPWVSNISVRRKWPNTLEVTIKERKAIASWNENSLLSAEGEIFQPSHDTYPKSLSTFKGPDGKQIIMLKYFLKMNRILQSLHAKISHMELTPYDSWMVKLDNGILLKIGSEGALTRLSHFVKVYPKVVQDRVNDVEYIDLRYSNGMAVRWKQKV